MTYAPHVKTYKKSQINEVWNLIGSWKG